MQKIQRQISLSEPSKVAVFVGLAALIGVAFWAALTAYPCSFGGACSTLHSAIQNGTADSPWRYRILLGVIPGTTLAFAVVHGVALAMLYSALYFYTRSFTPILLITAAIPPMFNASWGWVGLMTIVEATTWIVLLLLIKRRRDKLLLLIVLTFFAALNRETAVFLSVLYFLVTQKVAPSAIMLGVSLVVFAGLRLMLGAAPDSVPIADAWRLNTAGGWNTVNAVINLTLLAPVMLFGLMHRGAKVVRRALWIAVFYLPMVVIFGLWNETRLLLPLLALVSLRINTGYSNE